METSCWYLESRIDQRGRIRRSAVRPLPFRVGRRVDSDLFLNSSHGSGRHAELYEDGGDLWLRDLDSTNGTSVNGERLGAPRRLVSGDVIHFADTEFRIVELPPDTSPQTTQVFTPAEREMLEAQVKAPDAFRRMLAERAIRTVFQPVVRLEDGSVYGYEMLGRGHLGDVEASPAELFYIAERLGDEVALSEALRSRGLEQAAEVARGTREDAKFFMNTHPRELADPPALLASIEALRRDHPAPALVLELHEAAVTRLESLRALRRDLEQLEVAVAFDDFGTGQARLLELTEVAPQFLKFDAAWIEDLHLASARRREMVASLLRMITELDIVPVAECVESREEAEACRRLGFELAQGNHFGPPAAGDELLAGGGRSRG